MSSYFQMLSYFFRLPFHIQWRTFLVQLPRYVPLSILHITSPKGPHPFVIALPSRKNNAIPIYVFVPPAPADPDGDVSRRPRGEWKVPVVLDFHGGGFIMGSPLEQAPYAAMMSRETTAPHLSDIKTITLDPTRLAISGFSAGGNIALNMAISVPPCAETIANERRRTSVTSSSTEVLSPLLPPVRAPTKLDDPFQPWPSILPPPQAQPRMLPLLLFYPSLDARLLPHERPRKPLPNALHDDKKAQKPRMPGLFSILGPTYLPKKLRAHPRASPGLVNPENIQKNAAIFLVLPEKDTLAVQSDVWVDKMNSSGWNGPVRFGDGRAGDWNEHEGGPSLTEGHHNGGLEVWHAPKCRHGWTQFPETWLGKQEKRERDLVFARVLDFVREGWRKSVPVERLGSASQDMRPLRMPSDFEGLN